MDSISILSYLTNNLIITHCTSGSYAFSKFSIFKKKSVYWQFSHQIYDTTNCLLPKFRLFSVFYYTKTKKFNLQVMKTSGAMIFKMTTCLSSLEEEPACHYRLDRLKADLQKRLRYIKEKKLSQKSQYSNGCLQPHKLFSSSAPSC